MASDFTLGDGRESQAGKEDSPRMWWLLNLLSIGCRKETSAGLSELRIGVDSSE